MQVCLNIGLLPGKLERYKHATQNPAIRLGRLMDIIRNHAILGLQVDWAYPHRLASEPRVAVVVSLPDARWYSAAELDAWLDDLAVRLDQDAIAYSRGEECGLAGPGARSLVWDYNQFWDTRFPAPAPTAVAPLPRDQTGGYVAKQVDRAGGTRGVSVPQDFAALEARIVALGGTDTGRMHSARPEQKPFPRELPPVARVVRIGDRYYIQHPVHGRYRASKWDPRPAWYKHENTAWLVLPKDRAILDDPTAWLPMPPAWAPNLT